MFKKVGNFCLVGTYLDMDTCALVLAASLGALV